MREEEMLRWTHLVGKATAVGEKEVEETAVGVKVAAAREPTAEEEMGMSSRGSM